MHAMDEILVVNKLQDAFARAGVTPLDLPQVAVIGGQSSGKSSVLEAIVGHSFLPRGPDICTRRPLVLQLVNSAHLEGKRPPIDADTGEAAICWGEFMHAPDRQWTDFTAIKHEIEAETDRETTRWGISDKQIRLKIYAPDVLNLTLVDLPGLTRNPVGEQPLDIEHRLRALVLKYARHRTCILLAVTPGNMDLANSEALHLARECDPEGTRTLGVITKLDLVDHGASARAYLTGEVIPLRLGYVGVVNRSQRDVSTDKSIEAAIEDEAQFFRSSEEYSDLADVCGIRFLAKTLHRILASHIRKGLPELRAMCRKQLDELRGEAQSIVGPIPDGDEGARATLILTLITKFAQEYSLVIDGRGDQLSMTELTGGSRISHLFTSVFTTALQRLSPGEGLSDEEIRTALLNTSGTKSVLFVPEASFEILVIRQIGFLRAPALNCARLVHEELGAIARKVGMMPAFSQFPGFRAQAEQCTTEYLDSLVRPTEDFISKLVDMETDYINLRHPDMITGSQAVGYALDMLAEERGQLEDTPVGDEAHDAQTLDASAQRAEKLQAPDASPYSEQERIEIEVIRILMASYYEIVRKNIADAIPKAIMHFLVNSSKRGLHAALIQHIYRPELFEAMLAEDEGVTAMRAARAKRREALVMAQHILDEL